MSDGRFYQWVNNGVMGRRGTLSLLVGLFLGWTGATLVDENRLAPSTATGTVGGESGGNDGGVGGTTDTPTTTPEPTDTATAEPTATATATPEPTTAEPTATATATPEPTTTPNRELRGELDVSSRGFGDETSYQIIYSIHNRNEVTVTVTFESTLSLQNGKTLRQEATATIEPGQAATDEFVFEGYDSSPSGWGFQVTDVKPA